MSKADGTEAQDRPKIAKAAVPAAAVGAAGAGIGLLVALKPKGLSRALSHLPGRAKPEPTGARKLLAGLERRVESLTSGGGRTNEKAGRSRANELRSRRRERKAGRERRKRHAKT